MQQQALPDNPVEALGRKIRQLFDEPGPKAPDRREIALLSDVARTLDFLNVPPRAVMPAAHLLAEALFFQNLHLWSHVIMRLQILVNKDGFRAKQFENIATHAKAKQDRLEALARLSTFGPKPEAAAEATA